MHLKRRKKLRPMIPLASMADIAFLLLIFFIVTSAMKSENPAKIRIPELPGVEVVEGEQRLDLWLHRDGVLKIRRRVFGLEEAGVYLQQRVALIPDSVIFLHGDRDCPFRSVERVLKTLTQSGAVRVVFVARRVAENG